MHAFGGELLGWLSSTGEVRTALNEQESSDAADFAAKLREFRIALAEKK